MPFGVKEEIDFDAVYSQLIQPALQQAGFEALRADEQKAGGNIRLDMFQELLLADLVLVDLTIDNPNVWYELGVRHALRARGIVHVSSREGKTPFDVGPDRQFRYSLSGGVPDADSVSAEISALAEAAVDTVESWRGRNISPIYTLLPYLKEPDWKSLRVGSSNQFWEQYEHWEQRIKIAGKRMRAGDILVLADETPTQHLRLEAHRTAAKALLDAGQLSFAEVQIERALEVDPDDLPSARLKGMLLGRIGRNHSADTWLTNLLEKHPDDAETLALLGRVRKKAWTDTWCKEDLSVEDRKLLASDNDGILREAISAYRRGFASDPRHYYSGINALSMLRIYEHLSLDTDTFGDLGRDVEGGLRWALASAPDDPWAAFTRGELELLCGNRSAAVRAYKDGVAATRRDWFALDAVRQQLRTFSLLEFQSELVGHITRVVQRALDQLKPPWQPRRIFLFSGHMVDKADRDTRRFPDHPAVIREARARIGTWLDEHDASEEDLALSSAACGGDLLFAQAALQRGLKLDIRLPFARADFLRSSVAFAGADWVQAFHTVTTAEDAKVRIMSDELGPAPSGINDYARNNLWMLYAALAGGIERLHFLCLWNGKEGDGPGGTRDMVDTIREHAGFVDIIDSEELLDAIGDDQ